LLTPVGSQPLPFQQPADKNGVSPTAMLTSAYIPAGTVIVVRLQSAVSSAAAHSGDSFGAVLDEPILVAGEMLAPRGAVVAGKVVVAKISDLGQDPGYLRLTLTAVSIGGKWVSLQTSSIFAKGGSGQRGAAGPTAPDNDRSKKDVEFSTEHRLSFRVLEYVPLSG
jgi:hypothetical protein